MIRGKEMSVAEVVDGNENKSTAEQRINDKIEDICLNRRKGADAAFEQGQRFAELRQLTEPYEKDKTSGLSYRQAVARTGYSW